MRISELKYKIDLQSPTKTSDGMGGFTVAWATAATVSAAIWPVNATETVSQLQTGLTVTHRIRIRYRANVLASWRISWSGRYFNIVSIIEPNTGHRWLDILCKEAA